MLEHRTLTCYREGCFATITLHPDDEARLRRTHETFYCPAGHGQVFTGKTKQEKLIDSLKEEIAGWRDDASSAWEECEQARDRLRLFARAVQTCPLGCGWQGNRRLDIYYSGRDGRFLDRIGFDLADHMAREHGLEVEVRDGRLVAPGMEDES